jgi:competence protein ComEA
MPPTTSDAVAALTATAAPLAAAAGIVVDVAGGVLNPGLRSLRDGDRVGDAIAAAGGFAPRADLAETSRVVNLAMPLTDGMKILVPELGTDPAPGGGPTSVDDGLIDLDSADQAELESLPGIGPVTAAEIIDAREAQPFDSVDDLRDRDVVGPSVFEQIRDLVRVGGG